MDPTASVIDGVLLHQTIFVGDGRDGATPDTGNVQSIRVPNGATRVFFGFHDFPLVPDLPGSYGNNTGQIAATLTISL